MAIERIEEYRQQNGDDILKVYTKPTRAFPSGGYFYTDAQAIDLVENHGWFLYRGGNNIYVTSKNRWGVDYRFHQELCMLYLGHYVDYIDHLNIVAFDNIDKNLNIVTQQQNQFNHFTKGYCYKTFQTKYKYFQATIQLNKQNYYPYSLTKKEDEVCIQQNYLEQVYLRDLMQEQYYMFDFKKYRRGSEDILDLERTGQISEEEATYRHILKYSDNAWYYLRFGLEDYYRENHISIPQYSLDSDGFMVHSITGQKLCPFYNSK